ncbi:hypothetical protein BD410DRAFT_798608 [Rickenella mellea]|uniref:Uncharacterized protein n=1 Tax=Rickenella mellea TaxID=50990 RepID=A0A4R5XG94_9AGAM|nr:hypothetical protein BD410DRAFT_798608 [Rickenella mellea]
MTSATRGTSCAIGSCDERNGVGTKGTSATRGTSCAIDRATRRTSLGTCDNDECDEGDKLRDRVAQREERGWDERGQFGAERSEGTAGGKRARSKEKRNAGSGSEHAISGQNAKTHIFEG